MGPVATSAVTRALLVLLSITVSVALTALLSVMFRDGVELDYLATGLIVSGVVSTGIVHIIARYEARLTRAHADVLSLTDELKQSNEQLRQAAAKARALGAARSRFLATMSHEIRTPLAGLVGVARLLARTDLDPAQRRLVELQLQSSGWLRQIVDGVLDLAKVEAGKAHSDVGPVDLGALTDGVLRVMRVLAEEKDLTLSGDFAEALPQWVVGERCLLERALLNLLANAIRFASKGQVVLRAEVDGDHLRFQVLDRGVGVDPSEVEQLFEPYRSARGGTGLGLPLVRLIAEQHGGTAGAEPREGGGSIFWFTARLPQTDPPAQPEPPSARLTGQLRVLVAENSSVNRLVLCRMLELQGHQVHAVSDGQAALDALAERPVDLVLMDIDMPVLDGCAATEALRKAGRDLPVVGVTASVLPSDVKRCLDAGMDRVLHKPGTP